MELDELCQSIYSLMFDKILCRKCNLSVYWVSFLVLFSIFFLFMVNSLALIIISIIIEITVITYLSFWTPFCNFLLIMNDDLTVCVQCWRLFDPISWLWLCPSPCSILTQTLTFSGPWFFIWWGWTQNSPASGAGWSGVDAADSTQQGSASTATADVATQPGACPAQESHHAHWWILQPWPLLRGSGQRLTSSWHQGVADVRREGGGGERGKEVTAAYSGMCGNGGDSLIWTWSHRKLGIQL